VLIHVRYILIYMKPGTYCESCLMPFKNDTGVRTSDKYCSLCYTDGKFCYEGNLKDFQKICYENMVKSGMNKVQAWIFAFMIRFAPRWKNMGSAQTPQTDKQPTIEIKSTE